MAHTDPKVSWRAGFQFKADPNLAWKAIEKVREDYGGDVPPEALVEAARARKHPLHNDFIWDDAEAANVQRTETSRCIIRSLVIIREESSQPCRVYETAILKGTEKEHSRKVYRTMEDIMADPQSRKDLLKRALGELESFQKRYHQLEKLATVLKAIDKVLEPV
jgi:hypothetical protein